MPKKEYQHRVNSHVIPKSRTAIEKYATEKGVPQHEVNHLVGSSETETLANIEADRGMQ